MAATAALIKRYISKLKQGQIFTTRDVLSYGTRSTVDFTLYRLIEKEIIIRLARGVFKKNDGSPLPSLETIARAKAMAFGKKMRVHGENAARELGLLPDLSSKHAVAYCVDGRSSSFKCRGITIHLRGTCKRKMVLKDSPAGQIIRALWNIGSTICDKEMVAQICHKIDRVQKWRLANAGGIMPAWLFRLFWPLLRYTRSLTTFA